MKPVLAILVATCFSAFAIEVPDTLAINGQTYKGVTYRSHDASRLNVMHETGLASVRIAELPADLQVKLGYDEDAASAAESAAQAKVAAAAAAIDQGSQVQEGTSFDWADFIDNTGNYKGKTITLTLRVNSSVFADEGRSLRNLIGRNVELYGFGPNSERLDVIVSIPSDLSVPNVAFAESVVVTFLCKEGNLRRGNEAKAIKRP